MKGFRVDNIHLPHPCPPRTRGGSCLSPCVRGDYRGGHHTLSPFHLFPGECELMRGYLENTNSSYHPHLASPLKGEGQVVRRFSHFHPSKVSGNS
jgi:hypothetical protein